MSKFFFYTNKSVNKHTARLMVNDYRSHMDACNTRSNMHFIGHWKSRCGFRAAFLFSYREIYQLAPLEPEHTVTNFKPILEVTTLHDKKSLTQNSEGFKIKQLASKKRKYIKLVTNIATK